jgi:MFS family permease
MLEDQSPPRRMGLVLAASSTGTIFEWYDFFIFGSLASIIARHFFGGAGETQGFIFALLTFAAGFFVRPFGALVFGFVGDRTGRKRAFLVTIAIMGFATFAIGLLPDTKTIGPAAPFLLLAMRVLQGFAVGGEYGGAAIYVAEHARPDRRGAATGWIQAAATLGLFLALAVILTLRTMLGEEAFTSWGWRVPFLLSVLLLGISLWIRLKLHESPLFRKMQEEGRLSRAPLREAFFEWRNLRLVLIVLFALLMGQGVVWYTAQFYSQFFLERVARVEPVVVYRLILTVTAISTILHIFFARISDFVGRKPVMLFGLGLAAATFLPSFQWLVEAVNPALAQAADRAPVTVIADAPDCSLQFDLLGKTKFVTSCDIAKSTLASQGIPYRNQKAAGGAVAVTEIGGQSLPSFDGARLGAPSFEAARKDYEARIKSALLKAGYPAHADTARIDNTRAILILLVLVLAASALYGPQAAALVELFPTRIRYSALSLPYHVGVGWFGGFLPATAFAIVATSGNIYSGVWYPVIVASIGFVVTLFFLPETRGRDITL